MQVLLVEPEQAEKDLRVLPTCSVIFSLSHTSHFADSGGVFLLSIGELELKLCLF